MRYLKGVPSSLSVYADLLRGSQLNFVLNEKALNAQFLILFFFSSEDDSKVN